MRLLEGRDSIALLYGKSDDIPFKDKIKADIINAYAELIRREINKPGFPSLSYVFSIKRVELEEVSKEESDIFNVSCSLFRTKKRIPKPITAKSQRSGFIFVGSSSGDNPMKFVLPEELKYQVSKFNLKNTCYTYYGDRIYVFGEESKYISIRFIPANPTRLSEFSGSLEDQIEYENFEIGDDLFENIKTMIIEKTSILPNKREVVLNNEVDQE